MRESLPHAGWTLQRFGLSPAKFRYRLVDGGAPHVFCVSIPKAGTHLLERALCLHPRLYRKLLPTISDENIGRMNGLEGLLARLRPGQVVVSHLRSRPEYASLLTEGTTRGIFLVRDPHEIVVSQVHYVTKRTDHRAHELFASLPDLKARLRVAITGDPAHRLSSIRERLDSFAGWLDCCLIVRFEELVGPGGGGDPVAQLRTVDALFEHLEMEVDPATVRGICERLFSRESPTFRQGAIGAWRRSFDEELEELFDEIVGEQALLRYGYQPSGGRA
jgi:hypothetical protein